MASKQLGRMKALLEAGKCSCCARAREVDDGGTKWLCAKCAVKNRKASADWCRANYIPKKPKNKRGNKGKRHQRDGNCWCLPRLEVRETGKVWIHQGGIEHDG